MELIPIIKKDSYSLHEIRQHFNTYMPGWRYVKNLCTFDIFILHPSFIKRYEHDLKELKEIEEADYPEAAFVQYLCLKFMLGASTLGEAPKHYQTTIISSLCAPISRCTKHDDVLTKIYKNALFRVVDGHNIETVKQQFDKKQKDYFKKINRGTFDYRTVKTLVEEKLIFITDQLRQGRPTELYCFISKKEAIITTIDGIKNKHLYIKSSYLADYYGNNINRNDIDSKTLVNMFLAAENKDIINRINETIRINNYNNLKDKFNCDYEG